MSTVLSHNICMCRACIQHLCNIIQPCHLNCDIGHSGALVIIPYLALEMIHPTVLTLAGIFFKALDSVVHVPVAVSSSSAT